MAYMIDGKGPYPNEAGEYCGNHNSDWPVMHGPYESQEDADKRQAVYLATMRFGRPRPTSKFTTEQLEAEGWVGLYAKDSRPLRSGETECPTPPELLEPVMEVD